MRYREKYLLPYATGSEDFEKYEKIFTKCTNFLSDLREGKDPGSIEMTIHEEDAKECFQNLSAIFSKCQGVHFHIL